MDQLFWSNQTCNQILDIANSYGDLDFWYENLSPGMNPDAIWRACLLVGIKRYSKYIDPVRSFLDHKDSRVRAWATFALGEIKDDGSLAQLQAMTTDPSPRVRLHAHLACIKLNNDEPALTKGMQGGELGKVVLLSDDHGVAQDYFTRFFEIAGAKVFSADSHEETLKIVESHSPAILVTDNQKGTDNLSGLNLFSSLLQQPSSRETFLIMYTADDIEAITIWSGGDFFSRKPMYLRVSWLVNSGIFL